MSRQRSSRMRKVDELLHEVLAEEIALLKDPRIGFVTVTGVETSPDLRHASVFYSVLGEPEEWEATGEALQHAAPHLQARVAGQVRMKYTPRLEFHVDPSIAQGARMSQLLREIQDEEDDAS
jgi:ribosome-binding factor A